MHTKPTLIDIGHHLDDRGIIEVVEFQDRPSRVYFATNWMVGTVRGWHGHPYEWRLVTCVSGAAKIGVAEMREDGLIDPEFFILKAMEGKAVYIPDGYANGWKSLTHGSTLCYVAPTLYKDRDDVRYPWDIFGEQVWKSNNH